MYKVIYRTDEQQVVTHVVNAVAPAHRRVEFNTGARRNDTLFVLVRLLPVWTLQHWEGASPRLRMQTNI